MEVFTLVSAKRSALKAFIAWAAMCLAIICLLLSCSANFLFIFAVALAFLWYWLWLKSDTEYEYSYFEGELRFARVMDKSRRKALGVYKIEDVEKIAPAGNSEVVRFENDSNVVVKDYTSGVQGVPYYDVVIRTTDKTLLIKAELDNEYLDAVCIKHRSKVVR